MKKLFVCIFSCIIISQLFTLNNNKPFYNTYIHDCGLGRKIMTCDIFTHENASDHTSKWLFSQLNNKKNNIIYCDKESVEEIQREQHWLFEELVHKKHFRVKYELFLCINPSSDNDSCLKHYRYILYTKDHYSAIDDKIAEIF